MKSIVGDATPPRSSTATYGKSAGDCANAGETEAIQPLKMVIATDPTARNAYLILADCYLQTGQSREAVAMLDPREPRFGDDLASAYVLGTELLQTSDETRGEEYIR